jgi:hypothetical protein
MGEPDLELESVVCLDGLAELVGDRDDLFVRWSAGPVADRDGRSRDELTGLELPGLSVSALRVEPWWGRRPRRLWMARRLYDYRHLAHRRAQARPWILAGRECGRGPDNEPLVELLAAVAWVSEDAVAEAVQLVEDQGTAWGPLDRGEDRSRR